MAIYTRTGDKGKTALFNGKRVFKSDLRVSTYGTIDEVNSTIGVVISMLKSNTKSLKTELEEIQHDLFDIGSSLAFPSSPPLDGLERRSIEFEKRIDEMTKKMPELKNFILPGGGKAGSMLHVARTQARRAERMIVELMQKEEIDEQIVKYINRLSDLFFTMARFVNQLEKQSEITWKKK